MQTLLRPALVLFALLSLLVGVVYPMAVTGIARAVFPQQAAGSLIERDGKIVGSLLIGQHFSDPKYFWSRPSATSPGPNNAAGSSGSNLGPSNAALRDAVKDRVAALRAADPGNTVPIPIDLVTTSASGLDPDISLAAAEYQVARIARARNVAPERVRAFLAEHARQQTLRFLGEPRVNVLELNLALDGLTSAG
jgi:K+-transporting ATPase ATPase C chain